MIVSVPSFDRLHKVLVSVPSFDRLHGVPLKVVWGLRAKKLTPLHIQELK